MVEFSNPHNDHKILQIQICCFTTFEQSHTVRLQNPVNRFSPDGFYKERLKVHDFFFHKITLDQVSICEKSVSRS